MITNGFRLCQRSTFNLTFLCLTALSLLFLGSCNVTRKFESNEFLLTRNQVKVSGKVIMPDELEPYIQQQPNSKLFGLFRTNIALHNWGSKGEDTKFRKWLRTKAGSAPVLLDTAMASTSVKQMKLYLANRGFFHSTVTDTVIYRKKKAKVIYNVSPARPYLIRKVTYSIPDTQVARYVFRDTSLSPVKKGMRYDAYVFDEERTRITNYLKNNGFYKFSTNYIKFTIDTNLRMHMVDLTLEIINKVTPSLEDFSTWMTIPHKRYLINRIYIYPDFDHVSEFKGVYDTVPKTYESPGRGKPANTYYFLNQVPFRVKPRTITQAIFITPQSYYNLDDVNQTYSQLTGLQVFKYINLQFRDLPGEEKFTQAGREMIDCHIELSRKPVQAFSATTDGTNSGGAFGVQGSLGYQNYNIFNGAQLLKLNLSGSLQMQATDGSQGNKFFNTIELAANASITFPQFLIPIRPEKLHKNFKPKTTVSIGYNYQLQEHYNRHISNISFGYNWRQSEQISHLLNPVEISLVKIFKDAYFDSVIESQKDNRLKNQYTDHLVAGLKYTFTFNSQQINKLSDFVYIRANFETGGNLLYLANKLIYGTSWQPSTYKLFGLPFAQYVRPDVDFRYYQKMRNNFAIVYRFYGGIGIPYGNVSLLPFEKAFFAGGANGMRGWKMYGLGPGSYKNTDPSATFNQIGDIQLEGNVEYRFPIYDWIRGTVFMDAGNIWLLQDSPDLPGGKFEFSTFLTEVAIDAGIGLRFDFDFFIFRFDPAIPLRDPSFPLNERWRIDKLQLKNIVWNFGIGYPF